MIAFCSNRLGCFGSLLVSAALISGLRHTLIAHPRPRRGSASSGMPSLDHGARRSSCQRSPKAPAFLMGIGLGGFIDGIVLHQILQWHHMLSDTGDHPATTVAGLEDNTLADGFFHLATWFVVAAAMTLMVRAWRRGELAPPWRAHVGMLLAGWGAFNLVEGLIDHQLLGVHHVRDDLGAPLSWDLGFLAFGVVLVGTGLVLARAGQAGSSGQIRTS